MQPQAMKTWGFPGLAAYQQSSLTHERKQVTYSKYCMELFLMHAVGTRRHHLPRKHSICILPFCATFSGGSVWGILRGTAAYLRPCFFNRHSGAERIFRGHCVCWSNSSSFSMNLCFERKKSQRKRNGWERGE